MAIPEAAFSAIRLCSHITSTYAVRSAFLETATLLVIIDYFHDIQIVHSATGTRRNNQTISMQLLSVLTFDVDND